MTFVEGYIYMSTVGIGRCHTLRREIRRLLAFSCGERVARPVA